MRLKTLHAGTVLLKIFVIALIADVAADRICETRYPIVLVHGVFFRDFKHLNYWGRIPKELEKNGATIFYGEHGSAAAVMDSAKELETIKRRDSGCGGSLLQVCGIRS